MFTEENKNLLIEALSYIKRFNGKIVIVKYGGAAMIEEHLKQNFAQDIVLLQSLGMLPVIVHGGGPEVSKALEQLGNIEEACENYRTDLKIKNIETTYIVSNSNGLDVITSRAIMDLIRDCREKGKTVIFSSHRMGEVNQLCDDISIIYNGKLFFNDTLDKFKSEMTKPTFEEEFIYRVGE